jgi:hypothetical protein
MAINAAHVKSRIDKIDRILRWHRRHGGVLDLAAGRGVLQDGSTPERDRAYDAGREAAGPVPVDYERSVRRG